MIKDEERQRRAEWEERGRDASIGVGPNKQSGAYVEHALLLNDNDDEERDIK